MINIAMISRWHAHANGYARDFSNHPKTKVTVVWDENPERGKAWADELGCAFEADFDALLARPDVDAISGTPPTTMHKELYIKAAQAGKHIFTEKVLCPTKAEALEVKAAVEKAGVVFVISLPMRTRPEVLFAKQAMDDGLIGTPNYLRVRNCHSGISGNWLNDNFLDLTLAGGGAMMDLGAHPMYLCAHLLGKPKRISSVYNTLCDKPVDDNCVSVIEFENKVIAVSETGFVTNSAPFSFELSGTEGTFIYGGPEGRPMFKSSKIDGAAAGCWFSPKMPKPGVSAIEQFISAITEGTPVIFGLEDAVALSELMDGAYRSYRENRFVEFDF